MRARWGHRAGLAPSFLEEEGDDLGSGGYSSLAVLSTEVVEERGGFVVTPDLWRRLTPRADAVALPSGLLYATPRPTARLTGA